MNSLLIGILASCISMLLIWIFRSQLLPWLKSNILSDIPAISGEYELLMQPKIRTEENSNQDCMKNVELKQIGSKVWGDIIDEKMRTKSRFSGTISGSRILNFVFESSDSRVNEHGTAMLKLSYNGDELNGVVTSVCRHTENIRVVDVIMKRRYFA